MLCRNMKLEVTELFWNLVILANILTLHLMKFIGQIISGFWAYPVLSSFFKIKIPAAKIF